MLYLLVTGQAVGDYGNFRLLVETYKPGENEFSAIDLGNDTTLSVSGDSTSFPDSYTSNCTLGGDGNDVVRHCVGRATPHGPSLDFSPAADPCPAAMPQWYSWTAPSAGNLTVSATSGVFTAKVAIRTDAFSAAGGGVAELASCATAAAPVT